MGVRGLYKFIEQFCIKNEVNAFVNNNIENYKDKMMAIDVSHIIYRYGIGIRKSGKDKLSSSGEPVNHLYGMVCYIKFLIRNHIKPFFVFDGKSPTIKQNTVSDRKYRKLTATNKCSELSDTSSDEYIKQFKRGYFLSDKNIKECQELLKDCGIPYMEAINEAESQCAALVAKDKNFYGVVTEDIDASVFGTTKMLKNFKDGDNIIEISLSEILRVFLLEANTIRTIKGLQPLKKFGYYDFVNFVSMLETDYFNGVKTQNYYQLYEAYVINNYDIHDMITYLEKNNIMILPEAFYENWENVNKYYIETEVNNPDLIDKNFHRPNFYMLYKILTSYCGFEHHWVKDFCTELKYFHEYIQQKQNPTITIKMNNKYDSNNTNIKTNTNDSTFNSFKSCAQKKQRILQNGKY